MIMSMTGYGKAERAIQGTVITVEVRSLNNRFLDLIYRSPRMFVYKEAEVREHVKKFIERGKVTLNLNVQSDDYSLAGIRIDPTLVRQYTAMLQQLIRESNIKEEVRLEHLLTFPEIFAPNGQDDLYESLWQEILTCMDEALIELNRMRTAEGNALTAELLYRLQCCDQLIHEIENTSQSAVNEEFQKMQERIAKLLERTDLDPQRLHLEIAVIADKIDITEEIIRFRSHCRLFENIVRGNENKTGRKLTFITQEMGREINTIGSKSPQTEVIHRVVSLKEEIEKLREQLQNVE